MSANKQGHGLRGSRLQNWIEHERVHLAMHDHGDDLVTDIPDRNLSLRVPVATHVMLHRLAQKLGRSKTACAEEIIANAVRDVYQELGLPELRADDLVEYASLNEKALPEKAD